MSHLFYCFSSFLLKIFLLYISFYYLFSFARVNLFKFTSENDDPLHVNGNGMFNLFGRCEMLDAETMDFIISHWKDDPDIKYIFDSVGRVLMNPFTIPVCYMFSLSSCFFCIFVFLYNFYIFMCTFFCFNLQFTICTFFMQYLLDISPFRGYDDDGNKLPLSPFDVKQAAKQFKKFVRKSENLLRANLVCVLIFPFYFLFLFLWFLFLFSEYYTSIF